ncbi:hypothetical protein [Pseudonocardia humida]|uniref:Uncharacterized protein n=1 Tax=Pseudonocardia humida TaxID=2800819 RepID=A0ABT1A520_9PSEU|nr:hypothetical protein [Pseudonocardia humida]MCO1658112.1 hypothetical protein [Pseudonocardia humida]
MLIFFAIVGAVICAKTRVAAGAVIFSLIAIVLFIATPAGAGLPQALSAFLSAVDHAASPALTDGGADAADGTGVVQRVEGSGAVG